ncbi:nucleotide sugar dehydrogenase [Prochlorococcus sp. MIT 0604]|uniref:nucleotide sugar dehydrogenase n=1 Tax=Prochlorococcus sp. MIT 0604 TaxID=1501268 RepID=UPI0004F79401|nr:nucleotide sugar dehydrogenase [Prochlorococcus sp. MIT 0604]AIQ95476.1 UDP-glucose dehydrogenase [Prochlorococcus sp. MIT 0604]
MNSKLIPNLFDCKIAIIGQGYVGCPLTVNLAKELDNVNNSRSIIIGFDKSKKRLEELSKGIDTTNEINNIDFNKLKNLEFSNSLDKLLDCDIYIVAVPTPVDKCNKPDLNLLENATRLVAEQILKSKESNFKKIVIYESTVYPGATEEVCLPILLEITNLKFHEEISIAYSPERVNPGDKEHTLKDISKIVSASDPESLDLIYNLYSLIIEAEVYKANSIKVAEASKVVENVQRDLNIALVNELSMIFEKLDIDTSEVLDAANSKWNFTKYQPGLVGGHCIGVDPYYLTYKAELSGYHPEVILAGRRINDSMGDWIANTTIKKYIKSKPKLLSEINVLIMGFTYKANCPDIRNSKVYDIYKTLEEYGCNIDLYEPIANHLLIKEYYNIKVTKEYDFNSKYDIIIVAVAHNEFKSKDISYWISKTRKHSIIVDVKNILPINEKIWKI